MSAVAEIGATDEHFTPAMREALAAGECVLIHLPGDRPVAGYCWQDPTGHRPCCAACARSLAELLRRDGDVSSQGYRVHSLHAIEKGLSA